MNELKTQLTRLRDQILDGSIGSSRDWGGADVVIGPPPPPVPSGSGFYSAPQYIATFHHRELSWLFEQLYGLFGPHLDFVSKYEFFGRLADAADSYLEESVDNDNPGPLLVSVIDQCLLFVRRIDIAPGLEELGKVISAGKARKAQDWGGAGVVVGPPPRPVPSTEGFYPSPDYVATQHHRELSWLFKRLYELFVPYVDFINKFEFLGRLADVSNRYITKYGDEGQQELLSAVLHEAESMLVEFSTFGDLQPLISSEIGADPLENLISDGVQNEEDSKRTLRELGIEL